MKFWSNRKRSLKSQSAPLNMERLEDRMMMAVIPLVSGQVSTFRDADGTQVRVKLVGPGSGTIELENNLLTGAAIDSITLTGTTGQSKLKVSTRGGSVSGTTINDLVITKALNELGALKHLRAKKVYLSDGGQMVADGNIEKIHIRELGAGATIDIDGDVGKLKTRSLQSNSSVDVDGTLQKFVAAMLQTGSTVAAEQLDLAKVKRYSMGSSIEAGAGGIGKITAQQFYNSSIASEGFINDVVVHGNMMGSTVAGNIDAGSDGKFGTIDDFSIQSSADGNVGSVKIHGQMGSTSTKKSNIVATGTVAEVKVGGTDAKTMVNAPTIWEFAATDFITLDIEQVTGYTDQDIWIAVYGEEIATPANGAIPGTGPSYFLDASNVKQNKAGTRTNPIPKSTSGLYIGPDTPDMAILPSSTIQAWGTNLSLPVPIAGNQYTGRILISVGAPIQAQVIPGVWTVSAPSASSTADPSNGTFYDFLEFTVTNNNGTPNLDMDTSQVDSFGMPIKLEFFKTEGGATFDVDFKATTETSNLHKLSDVTNISELGIGMPVFGSIFSAGTTITQLDAALKTIHVNKPVTGQAAQASLVAKPAGPVGVQVDRDVIFGGGTSQQMLEFIKQQIALGYNQARPFLQSAAPYAKIGPKPIVNATDPMSGDIVIQTQNTTGMQMNDWVTISGVTGNTNANGTFQVSAVDQMNHTFTIPAQPNATYTGGGTWTWAITGATNPASADIVISTSNTDGLNIGDLVEISEVQGNTAANGLFSISAVSPGVSFALANSQGNAAYTSGGIWKAFSQNTNRLVSPKDITGAITSASDPNLLNNYFNEIIDAFFLNYFSGTAHNGATGGGNTFTVQSQASKMNVTYSGTVQAVTIPGYTGYALRLKDTSGMDPTNYDIIYPFFSTNLPASYTPAFGSTLTAPTWLAPQATESASQMIFACNGVFADNAVRGLGQTPALVLGDLENLISGAFNRGIALNDATTWGDISTWFQQNPSQATAHDIPAGIYNYWVEFWHQTGLMISDLAYAFAYDDKFGTSTDLNENNVAKAVITLGDWSATKATSTTAFTVIPTAANQGGPVTLTASVTGSGSPSGTVSFYIDGVPINPFDASSNPPEYPVALSSSTASITANLPALSDGSLTHTYTVTAVYSGDSNNLPSVAYNNSLQLTGVNGDFLMQFTPVNGQNGTYTVSISRLPGDNFGGTIAFSISPGNGGPSVPIGTITNPNTDAPTGTVTIPATFFPFTGSLNGSALITGIPNTDNLIASQTITGPHIPMGTTIQTMGPGANELTLDTTISNSGGPFTFYSNGLNAAFTITGLFTPTTGGPFTATAQLTIT